MHLHTPENKANVMLDGQDRRVKRTQRLLAQALVDLTLHKGYEAVTIRDITERADIGYATFFRHYADKDALLADVLDVVFDELLALLQGQRTANIAAEGTLLFRYVQEHSELCRVLLSSRGSAGMVQRVVTAGVHAMLARMPERDHALVPPEIAAHHVVTAAISLIQWWLEHDMPYTPERMGAIYRDLIVQPAYALAFQV